MDWLQSFAGNSGIPVLLFASFVIVFVAILAKKGIIAFEGKGIHLGDTISNASRIKQLQWDYLQAETEIALRSLPQEYLEDPKKWRTHYVLAKYRDVLEQAIILNNIIDDEEYIESKQVLAYSAVLKSTKDEFFRTPEFETYLNKLTAKIIKQFFKIKKKYSD